MKNRVGFIPLLLMPLLLVSALAAAEPAKPVFDAEAALKTLRAETDMVWVCVTAFLVFFMQAGFAYVEAGFTRAKNAVNILMKNISDFLIGSLAFWAFGFSIMFGPHIIKSFGIGELSFFDKLVEDKDGKPIAFNYGFLLFQMCFAGTAATIVSGAMAERTKFHAYLLFSLVCSGVIYPVFGSLVWSNLFDANNVGYLAKLNFIDFAGSTVVHSIGGWIGLAGAIMLGPRIGKFGREGAVNPILGHNMSISVLGMFILWFGWFGFNPGSTGVIKDGSFAIIAFTTNMAAVAGGSAAMLTSWIFFRRPDISMVVNGVLGGLVAITAPCNNVSGVSAVAIGAIAGVVVVFSVILLDKLHIDDPVGAVSVHGVCGMWGTLSVGLFASPLYGGGSATGLFYGGGFKQLGVQALGAGMAFAWALSAGLVLFYLMKITIGLRVSDHEEFEGLDILEHGIQAYPDDTTL